MRHRSASSNGKLPHRALVAALALALGACGGSSGPDQTLEKVASWAATARMTVQRRAAGATSARYTSNALHAAHDELQQEVQTLRASLDSSADSSTLAPPLRDEARDVAEHIATTVGALAATADATPEDYAALLRETGTLAWDGQRAQALADSAKK